MLAAASAAGRRGGERHGHQVVSARTIIEKKTVTTFRVGKQVHVTKISDQLTKYLTDAHSIEVQALAQLRSAPDIAGRSELAALYREHLDETEGHERRSATLLEARDAKPSRAKDTVMGVGGKGFLLFARLQPDTPGKLYAHALSYEALELASYELLRARRRTCRRRRRRRGRAARSREEERRDDASARGGVDAPSTLRSARIGRDDLDEQLRKYLADAHAIEEQAIGLSSARRSSRRRELASIYAEHLDESRDHAELLERG